jgi:hypothetical protein
MNLLLKGPRMPVAAASAMLGLFALIPAAQAAPSNRTAAAATINGMWALDPKDFNSEYDKHEPMPFTDKAKALEAERVARTTKVGQTLSDNSRKCLPIGMPGFMTNEFALEILETPGRVTFLSENSPLPRSIYLTETAHTTGLEPSWNGHSIGHWERAGGKTVLVVDTVNFNDRVGPIVQRGVHSPTTHMTERYYLQSPDVLVGEMTFEDPTYLTKPYTTVHHYNRIKGKAELWEYVCETDAAGWSERFSGDPEAKVKPTDK